MTKTEGSSIIERGLRNNPSSSWVKYSGDCSIELCSELESRTILLKNKNRTMAMAKTLKKEDSLTSSLFFLVALIIIPLTLNRNRIRAVLIDGLIFNIFKLVFRSFYPLKKRKSTSLSTDFLLKNSHLHI